jgi:catechol 2,3-dioxygenase-like lactoylglutathione lyase family enzyme
MRIGLTEIFVDDQKRARAFYTEVLGLQVKSDAPYSDTARWLTLVSPDDRNGTELLLTPTYAAAAALQAARRAAGSPAISLSTDDCRRTYQELKAKGTMFVSEPKQLDYGGTDAVFEDGCGNLLNLHQE